MRKWQPAPVFLLRGPGKQYEKAKNMTLKDEPICIQLIDVQYATGEEWRAITNSTRKNEVAGPKKK